MTSYYTKLTFIARKARKNEFLSFDYEKTSGEKSHRVVRTGVDISARFAKEGQPLKHEKGRGNWISKEAKRSGLRGMFVQRNGSWYLSATDCSPGVPSKHKVFLLDGISNLK